MGGRKGRKRGGGGTLERRFSPITNISGLTESLELSKHS